MNKKSRAITSSLAVVAILVGVGIGVYKYTSSTSAEGGVDSGIIVGLRGSDVAEAKILDDFGDGRGTLEALCFR